MKKIIRTIFIATVLLLGIPSISFSSGGIITYTDSSGLNPRSSPAYAGGYIVETFTTSGTFTVPVGISSVDYLVVAGGGGGGHWYGTGGGGGGMKTAIGYSVTPNASIIVTVGTGGGVSTNGNNSVFDSITSIGGGRGASNGAYNEAGGSGGSGGAGAGVAGTGGAGTSGQGNNGGAGGFGCGGSGGGAGGAGANCAVGGIGLQSSITGVSTYYAGGGGYGRPSGAGGAGGAGGGGAGGTSAGGVGTPGTINTGGGGGGSWSSDGGSGGSGIVVLRYLYINPVGTINVSSKKEDGSPLTSSWTISGPTLPDIEGSGTSQSYPSKPIGNYTITWGNVPGYVTPATQSLTLTSGSTTTFSGTYTLNTYTVSTSAGSGGTVSPSSRSVTSGSNTTFTVTPNAGYTASASGCGGSLSGTTYTTGAITGACTVTATFTLTSCPNGATVASSCTVCPTGQAYDGAYCVWCVGGCSGAGDIYGNGATCNNGALNPPYCSLCPDGEDISTGVCAPIVPPSLIGNGVCDEGETVLQDTACKPKTKFWQF